MPGWLCLEGFAFKAGREVDRRSRTAARVEAVPAQMSTLRHQFPRRLRLPLKLLLFHPTSRQREHYSPLLRTAQLLSQGQEMPSLAAVVFRTHEIPQRLAKARRRVTEHHNRLMTVACIPTSTRG